MKQPRATLYCLGFAMAGWGAALMAHAVTTTDFSRYQVVLDRKPFGEVAPIVVPGATDLAAAESFAKDYEMKAIIDDGDKIQVCVLDKKTNKHIYLDIGQEISGMQLVSVNYDKEEAVLKMGVETTVIKLHPDKDKNKGVASAMAGVPGLPSFGMPRKNMAAENTASPFNLNNQGSGTRKPFFSDIRRRGASPFQRMGTNVPFQAKSLESFFKPNTNMTTPFVSPFRPQVSPFTPVNTPAQDEGTAAVGQPVAQPADLNPQMQPSPDPGYSQTPIQPAIMPFTVPVEDDGTGESEE
ncbi:MAG: hypothetical protein KJ964_00195 [Verrucomicrobia bacterium]|nr:hypothetical protein [Verrucomicrobiota bacterium]MBU1736099.1 hypothetical protein [Verrucomicrobiota bacterium]MBU1857063.1 hypothetical protein [Verrucomicrobiota bacterium]